METKNQNQPKIIMHPASVEELVKRKNVIYVKPYSLKELAGMYGVTTRTLRNWMFPFQNEIGKRIGIYYSIKQVRVIFDNLDVPYTLELPITLEAA